MFPLTPLCVLVPMTILISLLIFQTETIVFVKLSIRSKSRDEVYCKVRGNVPVYFTFFHRPEMKYTMPITKGIQPASASPYQKP